MLSHYVNLFACKKVCKIDDNAMAHVCNVEICKYTCPVGACSNFVEHTHDES